MKKIALLIILVVISNLSIAQKLSGIWRVAYVRSVEQIYSVEDPGDIGEEDVRYTPGSAIIEFDEDKAVIHRFVDKPQKHIIKDGNILMEKETDLVVDAFDKDSLVLRAREDLETYIVLVPFMADAVQLEKRDLMNSQWQVELGSENPYLLDFHFSDTSSVICHYQGEKFGYAGSGEWKILNSGSYYALLITDRENFEEYVFNILSTSDEGITASISQQTDFETPSINKVRLVKQEPLP